MKVVQSETRQYQLVAKTKRKDMDGVVYLAAGEKDIWVKILKDKSAMKEEEVRNQVVNGYSSMFDTPLEIVRDGGKFVGYTFKGPEMDVVPVQEQPSPKPRKSKAGNIADLFGSSSSSSFGQGTGGGSTFSGPLQILALAGEEIVLFALNYFLFNSLFLRMVYNSFASEIWQGCSALGLNGVISGAAAIILTIFIFRKVFSGEMQMAVMLLAGLALFFLGIIAADAIILLLVMIAVAVIGTVQTYMTTIFVIIGVIIIIRIVIG